MTENTKNPNELNTLLNTEKLTSEALKLAQNNETLKLLLEGLKMKKSKTEVTDFLKSIFK